MLSTMEDNERDSHSTFFAERDWDSVANFWSGLMLRSSLPNFVSGDSGSEHGLTDLKSIHTVGIEEFTSADPRFKRQTFAVRIGYDGSKYNGYQLQKGVASVRTVESDVMIALGGRSCVAAGRTDKDVSSVSQIISFSTYDELTAEGLLSSMRASEPCQQGRLAVWEVVRAPKRFHALFSASWRRYIYLFPAKKGDFENGVDVDVAFVDRCLKRLEGIALPYNGFAFREDRGTDDSASDVCTLYRARAFLVDLVTGQEIGSKRNNRDDSAVRPLNSLEVEVSKGMEPSLAVGVELVGSRFLRRMVRLLVATAVRESVLLKVRMEEGEGIQGEAAMPVRRCGRNDSLLLDICVSGDRARAAKAVPGTGLALCGVGYSADELSLKKHNVMNSEKAEGAGKRRETEEQRNGTGSKKELLNAVKIAERLVPKRKIFEVTEEWVGTFRESLMSRNPELLYYPQRVFEFQVQVQSDATVIATTAASGRGVESCSKSTNDCFSVSNSSSNYVPELLSLSSAAPTPSHGTAAPVGAIDATGAVEGAKPITVLVTQNVAGVGSTVWDAEVILAHYLHTLPLHTIVKENVLELGAGTAVAAILCLKKGAAVTVQELAEVTPHSLECLHMNNVAATKMLSCVWGEECVRQATGIGEVEVVVEHVSTAKIIETEDVPCVNLSLDLKRELTPEMDEKVGRKKRKKSFSATKSVQKTSIAASHVARGRTLFDRVIMADVLYHTEDFSALISTVMGCLAPKGTVVVCFEQRRRNLDSFFDALVPLFHSHHKHSIHIMQLISDEHRLGVEEAAQHKVTFDLHILRSPISDV